MIGSRHRATLVVPAAEPVGTHVHRIATLLDEPGDGPFALVTPIGSEIDLGRTLHDQDLLDGTTLHLTRASEAPAPPEVADVTDAVAEHHDHAVRTWGPGDRARAAALGAGAATVGTLGALPPSLTALAVFAYAGAVTGAIGLRLGRRPAAGLLAAGVGIGASPGAAAALVDAAPALTAPPGLLALTTALAWCAVAAGWGGVARERPVLIGAAAGVSLCALALALLSTGTNVTVAAALVALVAVAALGALPAVSLLVSRVTALDDRVVEGGLPPRAEVTAAIDTAYRLSAWAVAGLALPVTLAVAHLIRTDNVWAQLLGATTLTVVLLRTRVAPSAAQAWILWVTGAAALAIGLVGASWTGDDLGAAIGATTLLAIGILALARPSTHARIRLRRLGDRLETLAAVALVPLLLGLLGVYTTLLEALR